MPLKMHTPHCKTKYLDSSWASAEFSKERQRELDRFPVRLVRRGIAYIKNEGKRDDQVPATVPWQSQPTSHTNRAEPCPRV